MDNVPVNDEQAAELRRWAISLSTDERQEVRAAAKGILLLLDELVDTNRQLVEERLLTVAEKIAASKRGR